MKQCYLIPLLSLCILCGCEREQAARQARGVMVVRPVEMATEETRVLPGVAREAKSVNVAFKTPGEISRLLVKEGDFVREGQLVAVLDDADYRLGVEALEIQHEQFAREFRRTDRLYREKSVSTNDYEKAKAGLRQLEVQLQSNRNKLEYTRLYAPASGRVQSVHFEEAEMVDAGTPVFSLVAAGPLEVEVYLPAGLYARREGIEAIYCRSSLEGSRAARMELIGIVPKADGNQLYKARLAFAEGCLPGISAGMNVEVDVHVADTNARPGVFTLPLRSVFEEGGEKRVWVLSADSTVHEVPVTLRGLDASGNAVVSGLRGGETVVKAGVNALREGDKVRVIAESSSTNAGGLL